MGKIAQLDASSLAWARDRFASYYRAADVPPPERFARREFAAFPFTTDPQMRRHAAFRTVEEFRRFLPREVPRHVYYSSAYYRLPDHPQMAAKEWLGADLIFDLDADHLRGADRLDYAAQLALVKERLISLLDDFLFGDFGIDPSTTQLAFSGGRGYHVHVRDPAFLSLGSPERRELVEYVMGVGFDPTTVVELRREADGSPTVGEEEAGATGATHRGARRAFQRLPPPEAPGWRGRTTRAVLSMLSRWESEGPAAAEAEMVAGGVPQPEARRLARVLVTKGAAGRIRASLSLEVFKGPVPKELVPVLLPRAAIAVQGETDAPVTTDIHRLIRLPGSLHGGTGLRVVPLTRGELDTFEPLRDAPVEAPAGEVASVVLAEAVEMTVGGASVRGAEGDRRELPTPLALFLVLRGQASVPPPPGS